MGIIESDSEQNKFNDVIGKLIVYYCKELCEDPIDGSRFDNIILDTLESLMDKIK